MTQPDFAALAELRLAEWKPVSQLRASVTRVERAAHPAIDVHNHLGRWLTEDDDWMVADVQALVAMMDAHGVQAMVNLDGMWGDEVSANVERYDSAYPGRFLTFCQLDWAVLTRAGGESAEGAADGVATLIASLDDSAARGARGVKVWKNLGLTHRDPDGSLILPDDERVIAVLRHAGELGLPVLIHTADPIAFFEPLDAHNERLDELMFAQDWWFGDSDRYPTFDTLLDAHAALVLACPGTQFIGAHAGCAAEDLDRVERLLAAAPNYSIDIAGRMAELGRQPRRFRSLIERFGDRVLFGTDIYPANDEQFELYFRFLESSDESFSYDPGSEIPGQGRWAVSALALADEQLAAVYAGNARRVLGLPESGSAD
ncbi:MULTISPECIES: amidohydrolase family protein [unclassified Leifsonia]|uniref:amidohydrolase family protein n=1 Tax=unclassified Leifsonia TaxID=2663824 RepID=UPI0006F3EA70|nr:MULTISPECIES: amidohydrolase family protein [unclassified Leifsonia]KQX08144.1 amidohydrolase [Leifsonia sp. Root1293]KRA12425.1 amidohydrolase [Leifsonia sp. Root60]